MDNQTSQQIFESLYEAIDGIALSAQARDNLSYYYSGHIYGEITYKGFTTILDIIKPKEGEVFYDLGSGTGKAVILAAMLYNFSKVVGVEILAELHQAAVDTLSKCQPENFKTNLSSIHLIKEDFKDVDFSAADIIFMNATCYRYEMTRDIVEKFEELKKGSRIVTSTMQLPLPSFQLQALGQLPYTWGEEATYLHTKTT